MSSLISFFFFFSSFSGHLSTAKGVGKERYKGEIYIPSRLRADTNPTPSKNSDVFLGYTGWSAGAFSPRTYELSEVPTKNGDSWTDSALVKACFKNSS